MLGGDSIRFTKMQALGNDYIYVDCTKDKVEQPAKLARLLSNRHYGIGSDGLILIRNSPVADFKMEMYNSDGSQGKMCGNGIRCVAKYVHDYGLSGKKELDIETLSGIRHIVLQLQNNEVQSICVDMGEPVFCPERIPVRVNTQRVIDYPLMVNDTEYRINCMSMGNPHCVIFVNDINKIILEKLGHSFEDTNLFPDGINLEAAEVVSRDIIRVRVWERGSGETLACGTGACATLVAAVLNGYSSRRAHIILPGGELLVRWEDKSVYMTGTAQTVFSGEIDVKE